ncbi:MAG: type II secretion system protein, partial [Phycisphaerae bacterium]
MRANKTFGHRIGRPGFTLTELLVVIGIIVLLISILIPTVLTVQKRAAEAEVRSQISRLDQAIQAYQLELQGLPGAAPNSY